MLLKEQNLQRCSAGELIHSIAVEHASEHEAVCGSKPIGRSTEKVKLLLNDSHLEPQAMKLQHHYGDDDLE
jgi:hypothetical protein